MSGLLGLKTTLKSVVSGTFKNQQKNHSICAIAATTTDDNTKKVT